MKPVKITSIAILFLAFLAGCGTSFQHENPVRNGFNDGSTLIPHDDETSWAAPYTVAKFRPVLDRCKLQCPDSGTSVNNGTDLQNAASRFFHVANTNKMEFYQSGKNNRTELRELSEWSTATTNARSLTARVKVQGVSPDMNEVTIFQIHESGAFPNEPLLRVSWIRYKYGLTNHVWSIRRTNVTSEACIYTDLGAPGNQYFKINITVITNRLTVTVNDAALVKNQGVGFWKKLTNYFKAGAYLQSEGYATIRFDALSMK